MPYAPKSLPDVDVAVIGAGTAGLAAYRAAAAVTSRVVLIESGVYGTTCARVGCMPSKLLIAAAEAAYHARHAEPFGVKAEVTVDGRAVLERVRRERDRFVGFVVEGVEKIPEERRLRGAARFVGRNTLQVDEATFHARSVVIATGSSPVVPPLFDGLGDRLVINDDVFEWETLPESVAVFGAGVIGLELGQALSRLGVRVRLFGRGGTVGPLTDPALRTLGHELVAAEFPFDPTAKIHGVQRDGDGVVIDFEQSGTRTQERFQYVLAATGRRPNVKGLNLEEAGVSLPSSGVPDHDRHTLQCGSSSVFIAGDVANDAPLLHEAADEGKIAGDNAARFPEVTPGHRRSLLAITFTDPNMAVIGSSWAELHGHRKGAEHNADAAARAADGLVTGVVSFADQGRSRVMLQNRGALHLYADRASGRMVGAEIIGPRAEHIAHLLAWAHQQKLTIDNMLDMPFYHPVIEEGLRTALRDASAKLKAGPRPTV